ncbi:MAG: DUF1223 domain-containing protein [Campylobacteraceae bacterium]|nr:DUF1223 domain-containing protein [Campylobacteraceae bacterium]
MKILFILSLLSSLLFSLEFKSSENKVTLIELYTSQGCSSCPPADKWLSSLKNKEDLFKTFIPMAFHITYWDFLGWKDTFAKEKFNNRQRYYSSNVWKKNSVYTPQFIIDAKEYKQWFTSQVFPPLKSSYAGVLSINLEKNTIDINFTHKNKNLNKNVIINIALLENDFNIYIKNGENKNKNLEHDFVVQSLESHKSNIINGRFTQTYKYKINTRKNKVLVVFISDKNGKQIQASASYL